MPNKNIKISPNGRAKISNEFKLYVIIYMRENNLSNKEALRKFLPHQSSNSAKTIREWKKIYLERGPLGFFNMNNNDNNTAKNINPDVDLKSLTREELENLAYHALLKSNVYYRELEILKKKQKITVPEKVHIVNELKPFFKLKDIIYNVNIAKTTYYDNLTEKEKVDKYIPVKELILDYFYYLYPIGYTRLRNYLRDHLPIAKKTVKKLMEELCLINPENNKEKPNYYFYENEDGPRKNQLKNKFKPQKPFTKYVLDMSEFKTQNTIVYLEVVIELYSHSIVAYNYSQKKDLSLSIGTIEKFSEYISNHYSEDILLHTDQGSNYTSKSFNNLLKKYNIKHSYSKKASPTQNSIVENFFGIFKRERYKIYNYRSVSQFEQAIDDYVIFFNTDRRGINDNLTPLERLKVYECKERNISTESIRPFLGLPTYD